MLGRLLQTGKGPSTLESSTEEEHTRSLLFPHTYNQRHASPPSSAPIHSPSFRMGPFDDKGGLDLNEAKDLRIVVAQDAFGVLDKPTLLFDTHRRELPEQNTHLAAHSPSLAFDVIKSTHARNRSSTVSGPSSAWSRTAKDAESNDRVSQLMDCMFGVTSVTKASSSTKMHVLMSGQEPAATSSPFINPVSPGTTQSTRTPIHRSRTSGTMQYGSQRGLVSPKEEGPHPQDMVLVTRMFSAPLPENKDTLPLKDVAPDYQTTYDSQHAEPESPLQPGSSGKKQKLVEKKTPMYAIGVIFYLPPLPDPRNTTNGTRPSSRSSFALTSLPSSYGSDMPSPWTMLDAIPDSLSSSVSEKRSFDGRVELITNIWDVVLRGLSFIEQSARLEILHLLQQVNQEMLNSTVKAPKGPQEQRTNQRNVYIRRPGALMHVASLQKSCKQVLSRLSHALRIPHVLTGLGFLDGHWLDEARYCVQICGAKQQNFFLFNLLTSFLGNHTQWMERLGPDWYKKQYRTQSKNRAAVQTLASRTVIVADRRSIARRLIFLLASFLPSAPGDENSSITSSNLMSPLMTPNLTGSFPSSAMFQEPARRTRQNASHSHQVSFGQNDTRQLSTSVSSNGSVRTTRSGVGTPQHLLGAKRSDDAMIRTGSILAIPNARGSLRKTSATNTTMTPDPATPVAYFSTTQDSYFPEGVTAEQSESLASANLAKHLRRGSSNLSNSSGPSMVWGSLLSNVSSLWGKKPDSSTLSNPVTPSTGVSTHGMRPKSVASSTSERVPHSKLESMVHEANIMSIENPEPKIQTEASTNMGQKREGSPEKSEILPPKLRVDPKDGVIDVDVDLPGFFSWSNSQDLGTSPEFRHYSPSSKSFRGQGFIRSNKSHAQAQSGVVRENVNVAGYLRRFHEDFSLQGVKPYTELYDDIKDSMSRELLAMNGGDPGSSEIGGSGQWCNVCTTLVADLRTFTIQRVVLQRRNRPPTSGSLANSSQTELGGVCSDFASETPMMGPAVIQEEQFLSETVMDFDATLTDAIERVLHPSDGFGHSAAAARMRHGRTTSSGTNTTSQSTPPGTSLPSSLRRGSRPTENVRSECRQAVEGALEEVVKSVNEDLLKHQKGRDIHGQTSAANEALKHGIKQGMKQENVLREGVKKWLLNVESRSVW